MAARQMSRFGGMVSFRVKGGAAAARSVCERAEIFTLAESLGGVESLVELPATMTHASVADSPLAVPPTTWCACRSGSSRSRTCSRTSTRCSPV